MGIFDWLFGKKEKTEIDWFGDRRKSHNKSVLNDNGLNEWYYEDGEIERRFYQKNGENHGEFTDYWENGNIGSEGNYKDGIKDGFWKEYYENGQLKSEGNYRVDVCKKQDGLWKEYYENGQLKSEGNYKFSTENTFSEPDGLWKKYYENGELEWEGEYKDGKVMSYKSWDKNGNEIDCQE